jgi:hypothetical protein
MTDDIELETVKQAIYLRGLFIHRFSSIEFALSELILRARQHSSYCAFGGLPWKFDSKLARLGSIINAEGPISAYKDELVATLGKFNEFAERRHFLVHGIMEIPKDAADRTTLGFRMYDHKKETNADGRNSSAVHNGHMDATLEQLQLLADSLQPISTNFSKLVSRICREIPLPLLHEHVDGRG